MSQIQEWKGSGSPGNIWLNQGLQQSTEGTNLQFFNKLSNDIMGEDHTESSEIQRPHHSFWCFLGHGFLQGWKRECQEWEEGVKQL